MKSAILPVLALLTLAGSALAQTSPAPGAPTPAVTAAPAGAAAPAIDVGAPPPPPPPGGPMADNRGPGGPDGHRPPPPPPARAAHFHLGRGDTVVDVKCAEDEPMKSCADLALQLLDHLQTGPKT